MKLWRFWVGVLGTREQGTTLACFRVGVALVILYSLLSIAANDECDVVVALAVLGDGDPGVAEPAVMAFLNTNPMVLWAKKELGLEFMRRDW